jgi:hypothetical protein
VELTIVDDVQAGERFASPGNSCANQIRLHVLDLAVSIERMTTSVVRVRFSIPEWQREISRTFCPA